MFWYLKTVFNSLNKNQNKLVVVKKGLYNSFENGIEKFSLKNFESFSKHNVLSAVAHTCTPFAPTKAKRRPEYHMNLISVS